VANLLRWIWRFFVFAVLTILSQLGGIAYLIALPFQRKLLAFALAYAALWGAAVFVAPMTGRVALPCVSNGPLQVQSPLYCALNRTYVTPQMFAVLDRLATQMNTAHPGTQTLVLDANFPFIDGFPLLPHLSHADGEKVDVAFYYKDAGGYLRGETRSPLGYFTFENGPTDCPKKWPTLRWDMGWIQSLRSNLTLDRARMNTLLSLIASDPVIGKAFIEPHLARSFSANHPKIRFQGCRAARHDDHIHLQL